MYHDVFMISKESLTDTFGTTPEMQPKSCHFFVTPLGIFREFLQWMRNCKRSLFIDW